MQVPSEDSDKQPIAGQEIEQRFIGNTPLQTSVLGFGASPLGNAYGQTDPDEAIAAVHFAIDHGINFFDVAPYYGATVAETQLGKALEGFRHRVLLATKCGRYGVSDFDFSASRITAGLEASLTRLRTDYVDLLQAHDVEFADVNQIVEETIPAMRKLQQAGKARYIGITGYSLSNLIRIASLVPVDSILTYCRYNLMIADASESLVPFAQQHGIGLINAAPLHMGLLTMDGAPAWHPAPSNVLEAGKRVVDVCTSAGMDASQVALKFCVNESAFASTLVGMATRQQVKSNIEALSLRLNPQLLAEIDEVVAPVHNTVWRSGKEENYG